MCGSSGFVAKNVWNVSKFKQLSICRIIKSCISLGADIRVSVYRYCPWWTTTPRCTQGSPWSSHQVEETGGFRKIQGGSGLRIFLIGNPTSDTCTTGKRRGVVKKAAWGGGGDEDPGQVSRSIAVRLNIFAAFSFCCCFPAVDHIHSADYIDKGQLVGGVNKKSTFQCPSLGFPKTIKRGDKSIIVWEI